MPHDSFPSLPGSVVLGKGFIVRVCDPRPIPKGLKPTEEEKRSLALKMGRWLTGFLTPRVNISSEPLARGDVSVFWDWRQMPVVHVRFSFRSGQWIYAKGRSDWAEVEGFPIWVRSGALGEMRLEFLWVLLWPGESVPLRSLWIFAPWSYFYRCVSCRDSCVLRSTWPLAGSSSGLHSAWQFFLARKGLLALLWNIHTCIWREPGLLQRAFAMHSCFSLQVSDWKSRGGSIFESSG